MPSVNCEINLILIWFVLFLWKLEQKNCNNIYKASFSHCNFIVSRLLKKLQSGFKRIINQNKYQSKVTEQA